MTAYVSHTTFDAENAYALSEWWKRVLGYTDMPGDPNEPGDEQCMILDATVIADRRGERGPGTGWVTFVDPEGNEFCVVRSPAEM